VDRSITPVRSRQIALDSSNMALVTRVAVSSVPHPRAVKQRIISCKATGPLYKELQIVAEEAARAGAAIVQETVDKPRNITLKGRTDLVTETDTASENAILEVIRKHFPSHAILGEEGGVTGDVTSDYLWCVDPLDGTTNFAHGYPSFSVLVACCKHATPVASTVIEFAGGPGTWVTREYSASRNGGSTMNGSPISVSNTKELVSSLVTTGFGYDHDEAWRANMGLFQEFTDITRGVRRLGSAGVDMCHVACGIVEAYWEPRLKPWDQAAGVLIAEEAGGTVTTMDGRAFSVFDRSVLVSNTHLHQDLLDIIEPVTTDLLVNKGVDLSQWFIPDGYRLHAGAQLE
jgi:myo-inositol-1(or 4)-monophosphatase